MLQLFWETAFGKIIESVLMYMKEWMLTFFEKFPREVDFVIILILLIVIAYLIFKQFQFRNISKKKNILGKEYYDIFEDVIYYQHNPTRNRIQMDTLKWDFKFTYNQNIPIFLDLKANWEIDFTANRHEINQIVLGISGGCFWENPNPAVTAYQGDSKLNPTAQKTQNDCASMHFPLNTVVQRKEKGKLKIEYHSEKFIIDDYDDDYIYLFPYSQAENVKYFEVKTEHPYECQIKPFMLKYENKTKRYKQIEVTKDKENIYKMHIEAPKGKEHLIKIHDMQPRDVLVLVFQKV